MTELISKYDFITHVGVVGTVIVDFYATWCSPCKMVAPILEELTQEGHTIYKADVDNAELKQIAEDFGIMSVPTIAIFKDGELSSTIVGTKPKEYYQAMFNK